MDALTRLARPLTDDRFDTSVASKFLYVAGLLLFVLSVLKVTSLRLSEAQLFFGLLLICCVSMQMLIAGLLLEIYGRPSARRGDEQQGGPAPIEANSSA